MKNFLFSFVLLLLALVSCQKQSDIVTPTTGKMLLPQVTLVQGSELVTKSADASVNKITYEFWVKSGSTWIPAGKELFKDGTGAQTANDYSWTTNYPNECQTCFIDVPLNMQIRVVAKVMKDNVVKFYGIYETPANGFTLNGTQIPLTQMMAYEINSRLRLDVSDVAKNTNFNFVFTFTGTVREVDYSNIVLGESSWIFTQTTNVRGFNAFPLMATGTSYSETFSINGSGHAGVAPVYMLGVTTFPTGHIVTEGTKTYFEIYEFFGRGSDGMQVRYSITRKNDNTPIKTNVLITATTATGTTATGITSAFANNWLQAGYNFTITMFADPQALGKGCFTTTLINNTEITGTVTL